MTMPTYPTMAGFGTAPMMPAMPGNKGTPNSASSMLHLMFSNIH